MYKLVTWRKAKYLIVSNF